MRVGHQNLNRIIPSLAAFTDFIRLAMHWSSVSVQVASSEITKDNLILLDHEQFFNDSKRAYAVATFRIIPICKV